MSQPDHSGPGSRCVPSFRLLSENQVRELHQATLKILETIGVKVMHGGALQMLKEAGCPVDKDRIVRIPSHLVENSLQTAPSRVTVYERRGKPAMQLEGRNVYFGLGTDLLHTRDIHSGELRDSRLQSTC